MAASKGYAAIGNLLLKSRDLDVNQRDEKGMAALVRAQLAGKRAIVSILIRVTEIDNSFVPEDHAVLAVAKPGRFTASSRKPPVSWDPPAPSVTKGLSPKRIAVSRPVHSVRRGPHPGNEI